MRWWQGLLLLSALCIITSTNIFFPLARGVPQNLTEHSWIYASGYSSDMRIYQTESGLAGQKLVMGTRGTGTISRTIDAQVYGGYPDGYDEIWANEWGVYQNKPAKFAGVTQSDLKNALCSKNYEVGSQFSESYSDITDLVKDTSISQTDQNSVYDIKSEIEGTAKIGARIQKSSTATPIYSMSGMYSGYANIHIQLETGNASILTLPCP
ncbi:Uncharacterised protein [uncultured archaeon]|nr:Uncharacterised protein [uncultured archaeon]